MKQQRDVSLIVCSLDIMQQCLLMVRQVSDDVFNDVMLINWYCK